MTKDGTLLSVIIVTYNSQKDILGCLTSVFATNNIPLKQLEVIIVDNSSLSVFMEMKQLVEAHFSNAVTFLHNSKNGGYGQGNNVGIRESKGNHVVIINPDVILLRSMFKQAIELFQNNNKLALIGGKQLGGKNISFWNRAEYDFFIFTAPLLILFNKLNLYTEKYFYLSGALLFIDKSKFRQSGLFDENFFLYCEESDITKRLHQKGFQTKFVKAFVYKHLVDGRDDVSDSSFIRLMESSRLYLEKHGYSYRKFIRRKIWSYQIMKLLYKLSGKNLQGAKTEMFLNKFRILYKKI